MENYFLYILIGTVSWNLFAISIQGSTRVLLDREVMVRNVIFPKEILIFSNVGIHHFLSARVKKQNEELKFTFPNKRYVTIRADGREIVDIEKLEPTGIVNLALYTKQNEIIRIPFARWLKTYKKVPLGKPRFHSIANYEGMLKFP
jgi:hypothetical protein